MGKIRTTAAVIRATAVYLSGGLPDTETDVESAPTQGSGR